MPPQIKHRDGEVMQCCNGLATNDRCPNKAKWRASYIYEPKSFHLVCYCDIHRSSDDVPLVELTP
jgi:hypothetical protein